MLVKKGYHGQDLSNRYSKDSELIYMSRSIDRVQAPLQLPSLGGKFFLSESLHSRGYLASVRCTCHSVRIQTVPAICEEY